MHPTGSNSIPGTKETIDTLSKACAYGDFDRLRSFLESDPASVNRPDDQGYYPLQWAALNNRVAETTLLLSNGANVNLCDQSGQSAAHWAAVRGSLPVLETLLRHNADYEIKDSRGYTLCHVAAQYGQTAVLYHLALKWGVDVDAPDGDGRTPLHWAAYKGYADTARLLLVLDARYTLADKEGCTPLHWAAIKGNGEACTVLLQGGASAVLTLKDVTGSTPPELALEKGHKYLGLHLAEYRSKLEGGGGACGKNGRCGWVAQTQLCPVIWMLILGLVALYIHKVTTAANIAMAPGMRVWAWSVVLAAGAGLMFLYLTTTSDPGYIPTGWDTSGKRDHGASSPLSSSSQHAGLDSPALWAGNWQQLCVSCRIVRPLRAKHDAVTDRCIEVFDHYCPWVGNAIGKGNRHFFLAFLWVELYAMLVAAVVAFVVLRQRFGKDSFDSDVIYLLVFEAVDVFVCISVAALAIAQASQVARNVTTNELANWHRYKYLQGGDGHFHNPFNKGLGTNCGEACYPHKVPMAPVFLAKDPESLGCCSSKSCKSCG